MIKDKISGSLQKDKYPYFGGYDHEVGTES